MIQGDRIYFQGLDGIRAIAAIIVIIFHIDQFLYLFGLPSFNYHKTGMAYFGVILFFVLSGYLITYLLLTEKIKYGQVDLARFYMRRVLRIWPIYYLVLVVSFLLISNDLMAPNSDIQLTFILHSSFLSNVSFSFGFSLLSIAPLWSVAVEEQFYFFWPFLINNSKRIVYSLIAFALIYLFLKVCLRFTENGPLYSLISMTTFDSMAVGGIGAYCVFSNSRILKLFYHPAIQVISWALLVGSVLFKPFHVSSLIDTEIHSFFYLVIIVNVSTNSNSIVKLNGSIYNLIGQISYGLYVYHMLLILILSYALKDVLLFVNDSFLRYLIVYFSVIFSTFFVAYVSYVFFEKIFLRYKLRFSKILSYK